MYLLRNRMLQIRIFSFVLVFSYIVVSLPQNYFLVLGFCFIIDIHYRKTRCENLLFSVVYCF